MDTKWRKSKAFGAFLSFALGVSLTLVSLLPLAISFFQSGGWQTWQDAFSENFMDTAEFRQYMENRLDTFLTMAVGGPLYGDYYVEGEAIETTIISSVALSEGGYDVYEPAVTPAPTQDQKERWKQEIETYEKAIREDKNILYRISYDGKLLYSNTDQFLHNPPPTGYGFLLRYENGKCTAYRGGQEFNLYNGNVDTGINYREDDPLQWRVPGYLNYPVDEELAKAKVEVAVTNTPVTYYNANSKWSSGQLYYLVQNLKQTKVHAVQRLKTLGIGLGLLLIAFLLRKDKARADQAFARVTGHLWFEVKLLLLFSSLFPLAYILSRMGITVEMQEIAYAYNGRTFLFDPSYWLLVFAEFVSYSSSLTCFLILGWTVYFFYNDLRYGDKPWRHGIFGMILAGSLKQPIQKRIGRQNGWLALALFILGFELIYFLIVSTINRLLPAWAIWNLFLLPLLFAIAIYLLCLRRSQALAQDLGGLTDQITAVRNGDFKVTALPENSDLGKISQAVADIQQGMARAVEEHTRSERMKVELITNVSHDLKTPLTSIISYAELLKQEELEPPAGEYVEILSQKAERLRTMVLDVFEVSKAASGQLPVKLEKLDLGKLLRQTMADMEQQITDAPVSLRPTLPEEPVFIIADGDRLYRVFQNLLQNALQYALEGSRVYLSLTLDKGRAVVSVKNTSKTELPADTDFTARFVRGDQSRTDGGSGLGLAIAQSFTEACGGTLAVEPVADLFVVTVTFPLSENP